MTLPMSHRIVPATAADLPHVQALLRMHALPIDGVDGLLDTMLVSHTRGEVIGCAALEFYADAALVRSVAVDPGWQGRGLGAELVEKAAWMAQKRGAVTLFLLTTDAAEYFARHGFTRCSRDDAPEEMRGSPEFTTLCPQTAVPMRRSLTR